MNISEHNLVFPSAIVTMPGLFVGPSLARPFEYLRLTSLGVIGALVKVDDPEAGAAGAERAPWFVEFLVLVFPWFSHRNTNSEQIVLLRLFIFCSYFASFSFQALQKYIVSI